MQSFTFVSILDANKRTAARERRYLHEYVSGKRLRILEFLRIQQSDNMSFSSGASKRCRTFTKTDEKGNMFEKSWQIFTIVWRRLDEGINIHCRLWPIPINQGFSAYLYHFISDEMIFFVAGKGKNRLTLSENVIFFNSEMKMSKNNIIVPRTMWRHDVLFSLQSACLFL